MPATLGGTPPEHPFVGDLSGGFSRTIFETDEDPNFKLVIRDFSFPPDRQTHTVTLPSAAFLHILGGQGEISIAKKPLALSPVARTAVPVTDGPLPTNGIRIATTIRAPARSPMQAIFPTRSSAGRQIG